jgi:hypothetical protein
LLGVRTIILGGAVAAAIVVVGYSLLPSKPQQRAWAPDPVLAPAHIADDPYLTLPPQFHDAEVRQALKTAVTDAYARSDFVKLEAMAKFYRDTAARTPAGTWKLSLFYNNLSMQDEDSHPDGENSFFAAEKKDESWIAAFPKSPTPYIVNAEQLTNHGWFHRGNGYARTVTQEGWESFREYLAFAQSVLEKNKSVASSDPEWYPAMLTIALGLSWTKDQFEPVIREGSNRFPLYYDIYRSGARFYLPIWGGNIDDFDTFANYAVSKTRATDGTTLYGRVYTINGFYYLFRESHAQWPRLFNALQGMQQLYPDPRNENKFALYACIAEDRKWTAIMMPQIEKSPDMDIWKTKTYFEGCRNFALGKKS